MYDGVERRGMYGVAIGGVPTDRLGTVAEDWPTWTVEVEEGPAHNGEATFFGSDRSLVCMADGSVLHLELNDGGGTARLVTPLDLNPAELAHPHLAPVGSVSAFWRGWIAMHAGAFVIDGKAWLIPATKESGKTSTLAQAFRLGIPIVSDDICVIDANLDVYAGPRFVDLRADVAQSLGWGEPIGHLGLRERWRMPVTDCDPSYPLGGFLFPEFGQQLSRRPGASEVISRILAHSLVRFPGRRVELVFEAATSTNALVWTRPHGLGTLKTSVEHLIEMLHTQNEPE